MTLAYADFLERKVDTAPAVGFEAEDISDVLFPFQRDIVAWALGRGKAAIFASTGLGKTLMQLEWAAHVPGRVLILAPLAVGAQTSREASKLGMDVPYLRADDANHEIVITNYERLHHFDPRAFSGVVLDESSILKSLDGKTRKALSEAFAETPFKLCCTATPAPNDHAELGQHAEFLGVMRAKEMLARWFINDTATASQTWRLKRHAEQDFWRWVASWAVSCSKPSDINPDYDDGAFDLPGIFYRLHTVADPDKAAERGVLFEGAQDLSATAMWKDKADTAQARCELVAALVRENDGPWVVWCETNKESDLLSRLLPGAAVVRGDQSVEAKEATLEAFALGEQRILITKPSICGHGLNWQHCSQMAFTSLSYSFERLFQAVRRVWRFGQEDAVDVHIVTAASEAGIVAALERKQEAHERMHESMVEATRAHQLAGHSVKARVQIERRDGTDWTLYRGDCVDVLGAIGDDEVGLSVFSPPFVDIFTYSSELADMGNSRSRDEFFAHMGYMIPELLRVTKSGRLACVHCSDLPRHKHAEGVIGLYDFPADLVRAFEAGGWTLHSRIIIWRDPVVEMQRTKSLGLLHKTFSTRREAVRQGICDQVLVFRKWTDDMPDKQITGLADPADYIGTEPPASNGDSAGASISVWQKYASPVWFDIDQTRVLNVRDARTDQDEKHLCPLQLDVIERCVWLWSNPDDLVLDPFAGVGSTGYVALKEGRRFVGAELKDSYAQQAEKHLERALLERAQGDLFTPTPEPERKLT